MGNYHRRSQEASHIIYEKYPISKLQSHLEMDRPKIGLQFGLLSLPRSPIKGFLSGCKPLACAYTAPASPFDGTPGQLDSSPLQHRTVPEVFSFDAEMGLVSDFLFLAVADIPSPCLDTCCSSQTDQDKVDLNLTVDHPLSFGSFLRILDQLDRKGGCYDANYAPVWKWLDPSGWIGGC